MSYSMPLHRNHRNHTISNMLLQETVHYVHCQYLTRIIAHTTARSATPPMTKLCTADARGDTFPSLYASLAEAAPSLFEISTSVSNVPKPSPPTFSSKVRSLFHCFMPISFGMLLLTALLTLTSFLDAGSPGEDAAYSQIGCIDVHKNRNLCIEP